ncbi:HAD family phosphatase [Candidatus Woesearchaeota archaeon]|nr:HAD family phosphatase [Candidatus Woesearchaeota archaeon]
MITTIICDWGGVLSCGRYTPAILNVLSKKRQISIEKIYKEFNGLMIQMNEGLLSSSDFVKAVNEKFQLGLTEEKMQDIFRKAIIPNKEMIGLLKKIHSKYDLILLSDNDDITLNNLQKDHATMLALFRKMYFSHELKMAKPNKKLFEHVLADLNIEASKCIFIDDKQKNIDAARECGIRGIVFSSVEQTKKELALLGIV